ncbi:hypothetical protein AYO40_05255 [Planctomycetaceae bacterium SCGC AG-212-D15]|nr:hypothetical protein AYO40_05255 [Planctomycetaceae bacterium SCGC AG-212-D15]
MIHFSCPRCDQKFKVKEDFAGRKATCPACKQALIVPQPDMTVAHVPSDKIEGLESSVNKAGVDGGVTLAGDGAVAGPARSGHKSVKELLARRGKSGERYLIEGEIARGGMGAVLRAVDCDIRREVAVKYLLKQTDPRNKARFVEEAQITGQLEHPNIPPVHELGVDSQKRVFFAMKMVRGRSLAQILDELWKNPKTAEKEWPLSRLLTVFVSICNGLAYAHARGVIHRDLKPANVMVGDFGEVYVMDWGLAKVLDESPATALVASVVAGPAPSAVAVSATGSSPGNVATSREGDADLTQEGAVLGTPVYMPPEQAMGHIDAIDQRSDIYSLGAILYEILTFQPPVGREDGYLAILMRVTEGQIVLPEKRNQKRVIPKELSAIAMKALAKEPGQRYQTVEALRKDIERFQEGRSVSAKDDTKWEMLWKFAKRNKGFSAGATMTVAVVLFAFFFLAKAYADLTSERRARRDQGKASVPSFVRAGRMLVNEGRFDDALAQADVALDFDPKAADAKLLRGHILIGQLRYSEAHDQLVAYVKLQPDDSGAKTLAERCKQTNKDNSGEMLALADELNRQKLFAIGDEVTGQAAKLVKSRSELLPSYQKRIQAAWPKVGVDRLKVGDDGLYLDLGYAGPVTDLAPIRGMPLVRLGLAHCEIRDLLPLKEMPLRRLNLARCERLTDLSPLEGMQLTELDLGWSFAVSDLSPLKGMPLRWLNLEHCVKVRDLTPLHGVPLTSLNLRDCWEVKDLTPLRGMPLLTLQLHDGCPVRDVRPLDGMKLVELTLPPKVDSGMNVIRLMKTLTKINQIPAADFWKQYDDGKFPQLKP